MALQKALFGTNGIRGVVNEEMTPEFATQVGLALGTYFNEKKVLLGYDIRTSNIILSKAVTSGMNSTGTNVVNVGLAPTPAIQFAVKYFKMDGAVIITASHNPPEYNGIKVVAADGVEITREEEEKIEEIFYKESFSRKKWDCLGNTEDLTGVIEVYIKAVKSHLDITSIHNKHLKVVIDPVNSVGGLATPRLLQEIGCEVITINAQLDGHFPSRLPEPKPETLDKLSIAVKAFNADIGIAHDGDADRCVFVDEKGTVCLGDKSGAIIIDYILEKSPSPIVVTPISTSKLVEDIVRKRGSQIKWTVVGSTQVSKEMLEVNSVISMEDNGGIFYSPHQPVRDGAMAAGLMLEILAKRGKSLSELVDELPAYYIIKERLDCPNEKKKSVLIELLELTKEYNRTTIDGVKIFFDDGSILIRPSGTEAIYRVSAEAKTERRAKELSELGISLMRKSLANS